MARISPRSRQRPRHSSISGEAASADEYAANVDDDEKDKTTKGSKGSNHHHTNARHLHQRPAEMSAMRYHCSRLWILLRANRSKIFSMWLASAGLKIVVLLLLFAFGIVSKHGPEFPFLSDGTAEEQALLSGPRVDVTKLPSARQPAKRVPIAGLTSRRRLSEMGYTDKPRAVGHYFHVDGSLLGTQRLDPYLVRRQKEKSVYVEEGQLERQFHLHNSRSYRNRQPDEIPEGCSPQYDWQMTSYPSCNQIMEMDMTQPFVTGWDGISHEATRVVNNGYWRDVWGVKEFDGSRVAAKTMRYEHEFEARNYDRHRKDALASERLTSSPYVANIYSFCGNTGIFDFANEGDIDSLIWNEDEKDDEYAMPSLQKLELALQISRGIAASHNSDKEGRASLAHTDISPGQFIMIDGLYKLNDFNRARMIFWNNEEDDACPFYVGNNPGKFRSPEEYLYLGESEKIDIYSMGNVFYSLLTGKWPFENRKTKEAQRLVKNSERPPIDKEIRESDDPLDVALQKALERCWEQDPVERASAREIEQFLEAELAKYNKNRQDKPRHSGPKKDPPIKASKENQADPPTQAKKKKAAKDPPKALKKVQWVE